MQPTIHKTHKPKTEENNLNLKSQKHKIKLIAGKHGRYETWFDLLVQK